MKDHTLAGCSFSAVSACRWPGETWQPCVRLISHFPVAKINNAGNNTRELQSVSWAQESETLRGFLLPFLGLLASGAKRSARKYYLVFFIITLNCEMTHGDALVIKVNSVVKKDSMARVSPCNVVT